jgi:hypothetical protein
MIRTYELHSYRSLNTAIVVAKSIPTPYFLIRDDAKSLDRSAMLAGIVKTKHEALQATIADIARLTSVVIPGEEDRARDLLETLIFAKQEYVYTEANRKKR